jgi:hypothetical protein
MTVSFHHTTFFFLKSGQNKIAGPMQSKKKARKKEAVCEFKARPPPFTYHLKRAEGLS